MERQDASDSGADGTRSSEIGEERGEGDRVAEGVLCVKVMTDEQVEVLRRQIAVYATICEQLVEMHRAFAADQDSLAGIFFLPLRLSQETKTKILERGEFWIEKKGVFSEPFSWYYPSFPILGLSVSI